MPTNTKNKKSSSAKSSSKKATTSASAKNTKKSRKKLFAELRKRLEEEREQLLLEAKKSHNVTEINAHGDIVDQSNDYTDRELLLGLAEHDKQRLMEINAALERMDNGTYGICEMSGEEISDERLIAMPTARYTLECQAKIEGGQ